MNKRYLGDGVYVDFDGYSLVLTAENGITATNCIVLEPVVYRALVLYADALQKPDEPEPREPDYGGASAAERLERDSFDADRGAR